MWFFHGVTGFACLLYRIATLDADQNNVKEPKISITSSLVAKVAASACENDQWRMRFVA